MHVDPESQVTIEGVMAAHCRGGTGDRASMVLGDMDQCVRKAKRTLGSLILIYRNFNRSTDATSGIARLIAQGKM